MPEEKVSACPSCGYTKQDAQFHGDHRLCKNAGNAPWEKKISHAPAADAGPRQPELTTEEQEINALAPGTIRLPKGAPVPQEAAPMNDDLLLAIAEQIGEVERDMIGDSIPPSIITDIIRKAVQHVAR